MASRQKVNENVNWISPIFIITEFQNKWDCEHGDRTIIWHLSEYNRMAFRYD